MASSDNFPPGTSLFDGRFAITGVIANGGQATTYDGIDKSNGTRVAIKRFSVRGASSWKEVELAERETRVLSGLDHPGLPRVISHFEEDGALYLVLEYIEGSTLEQLRAQHRLSQRDVIDYLEQVSEILEYLHSQSPPIVHRDIKPRNLIRKPDGRIVLVDFGSVRDHLKPEGGSTVVGTFGYMAPEQFQGRAMPASDTYGAAATALAALTGRDPDQLPHQGLRLDVEKALDASVSPRLTQLLVAALEPDPDKRPGSLKAALAKYRPSSTSQHGEPGHHETRQARRRERHEARRRRYDESSKSSERDGDWGEAPFHTPGYQRERGRKTHRDSRNTPGERWRSPDADVLDIDIVTPFSEVLRKAQVRRALQIPVLGLLAVMLLVVLRTVLWLVLGVIVPRVLFLVQRVTGARLAPAVKQTGQVGGVLREQLHEVTERLRDSRSDTGPRYRVATPEQKSRYEQVADDIEAGAAELEAEIENAVRDWTTPKKK